jgi:hypothetical protein
VVPLQQTATTKTSFLTFGVDPITAVTAHRLSSSGSSFSPCLMVIMTLVARVFYCLGKHIRKHLNKILPISTTCFISLFHSLLRFWLHWHPLHAEWSMISSLSNVLFCVCSMQVPPIISTLVSSLDQHKLNVLFLCTCMMEPNQIIDFTNSAYLHMMRFSGEIHLLIIICLCFTWKLFHSVSCVTANSEEDFATTIVVCFE